VLQREHLPAEAQRVAGEQAQLRERVDDHARGVHALGLVDQRSHHLAEFDSEGWKTSYDSDSA
jgi:hypothetical protein